MMIDLDVDSQGLDPDVSLCVSFSHDLDVLLTYFSSYL